MTDIFSTVQEIIADSLYVEKDEVTLQSNLMKDLGAESIDFLDIIFRLEQSFGIKLPKGELEKKARANLSEEEFAISGVIQPKGLVRLRELMPEIESSQFKEGLRLRDLPGLYTVQTFVKLVENQLKSGENASIATANVASAATI